MSHKFFMKNIQQNSAHALYSCSRLEYSTKSLNKKVFVDGNRVRRDKYLNRRCKGTFGKIQWLERRRCRITRSFFLFVLYKYLLATHVSTRVSIWFCDASLSQTYMKLPSIVLHTHSREVEFISVFSSQIFVKGGCNLYTRLYTKKDGNSREIVVCNMLYHAIWLHIAIHCILYLH